MVKVVSVTPRSRQFEAFKFDHNTTELPEGFPGTLKFDWVVQKLKPNQMTFRGWGGGEKTIRGPCWFVKKGNAPGHWQHQTPTAFDMNYTIVDPTPVDGDVLPHELDEVTYYAASSAAKALFNHRRRVYKKDFGREYIGFFDWLQGMKAQCLPPSGWKLIEQSQRPDGFIVQTLQKTSGTEITITQIADFVEMGDGSE